MSENKQIGGKDLIAMGYKPGKRFSEAIEYINNNPMTEDALIAYLDAISVENKTNYLELLPFDTNKLHVNIEYKNEVEKENVGNVVESMRILLRTPTTVEGSIMPDSCPAGEPGTIPVGGVVKTFNAIHPGMHSADICCSVMVSLIPYKNPKLVLDTAMSVTHFGPGGRDTYADRLPNNILKKIESNVFLSSQKSIEYAKYHLGTQGDGNHFLYVGHTDGYIAIVTHHGSRGFGAHLYKKGMEVAELYRKKISPNTLKVNAWIPSDTEDGKSYWEALQIVRERTKLNHALIHDEIIKEVGGELLGRHWNEHNFIFKDGDFFYHAKGATPIDKKFLPDTMGVQIIPLNMSQPVLLVNGKTNDSNMGFAPHGAGRNLSRTQHKKNNIGKTEEDLFFEETNNIDARFFSGNIDISELPSAYKNAEEIINQIKKFDLCDVVGIIKPYGCIMSGDRERDADRRKNIVENQLKNKE